MNNKHKKSLLKNLFLRKKRKNESLFKYIIGIFHLWLGLLSSIIICIICITGCIYAFKKQIIDLYNYDKVFMKPEQGNIDIDEIHQYFSFQNKEISSIFIPKNKNRTWIISYTDTNKTTYNTYFNPYNKKELGSNNNDLNAFFQIVLNIHRNLGLGNIGKQIVGASVLIFITLLISGFILWLPNKVKLLKQHLKIKFDAKPQRINYDLHQVLGFYSIIPLLFIAITGIYITYPWVKNMLIVSLGGDSITSISQQKTSETKDTDFTKLLNDMLDRQAEKEIKTNIPLSKVISETNNQLNYSGDLSITMPNENNPRYDIVKINSENWMTALLPDKISIDKMGNVKSKELFENKTLSEKFISLASPLHTGKIIGLPSIIFYFIISFIGFSLPITGFLIWWNKASKML